MNLLQTLENAGLDPKRTGKPGEYILQCPHCQKVKLAVNVDKGVWQCWTCGQGGGTFALSRWLGVKFESNVSPNIIKLKSKFIDAKPLQTVVKKDPECKLPREFKPLTNVNSGGILASKALGFVTGRGVTMEMIERWGLGYCTEGQYAGYIIIPVYDLDNNVRTFQGRRFYGVGDKNKNPYQVEKIVFNLRHAQSFPGIVIVEGPWDAMAQHVTLSKELNVSSIALLGHTCSVEQARQIAQFLKPEFTWIALDPDVKEEEREKVASALMAEGLKNVNICHPESDPDELSYSQSVILFENATKPIRRKIINV